MTVLIIILVIYIISAICSWNWVRIAHSDGGIYQTLSPNDSDLFMTYMPVVNTIFALSWIFKSPRDKKNNNIPKHFRVK